MKRATTVRTQITTPARLFKDDYPRAIDRHIDFFGDMRGAQSDPCGEALFDDCHAMPGRRMAVNE